MPKINARGDVAHGIGGLSMNLNNRALGRGAVFGWRTDDIIAGVDGMNERWIVSQLYVPSGLLTDIDVPLRQGGFHLPPPIKRPRTRSFRRSPYQISVGANVGYAGGGHVAWWLGSNNEQMKGVWSTTGFRSAAAGLLGMGPDGAICYKPDYQSNGPTRIREANGADWLLMGGAPGYVHLLGQQRVLCLVGMTPVVFNLPQPVYDASGGIWKTEAAFAGGRWWISYYSGSRGIVLHPFDSYQGFAVLPKGDGWHTIREIAPNVIRVAVGTTEGEQAGQVWVRDYDVVNNSVRDPWGANAWSATPIVDIRKINTGTIDPPNPPDVPPQPPAEGTMEDLQDYVKNHPMRRVLGTPKGVSQDATMKRAINSLRFVAAVARDRNKELGAPANDPIYGLQPKASGEFPHVVIDGQGYWGDGLRTKTEGVDIVSNREGEDAAPTWVNLDKINPGDRFAPPPPDAAFVRALGDTPDEPDQPDQPDEPDEPGPVSNGVTEAQLKIELDKLSHDWESKLQTRSAELERRIEKLEKGSVPDQPVPEPGDQLSVLKQILDILERAAKRFGL